MQSIKSSELISSLIISEENDVVFLIGAGCSITSGGMDANKLVQIFKNQIFCSEEGIQSEDSTCLETKEFKEKLEERFKNDKVSNPYAYYFEKAYPLLEDRNKFIKKHFNDLKPSLGYLCLANYLISHKVKTILTTNFDNLIQKAVSKIDFNYDVVNVSQNQVPKQKGELNIFKLHGDYNYDDLSNTDSETQYLNNQVLKVIDKIQTRKIVIIGYSGADNSVMECLRNYLLDNNSVQLIWCYINEFEPSKLFKKYFESFQNVLTCQIKNFDELFKKLYETDKHKNPFIDDVVESLEYEDFELKVENTKENLVTNCNKIIQLPEIYVDKNVHGKVDCELYNGVFYKYGRNIYFIPRSENVVKSLKGIGHHIDKIDFSLVSELILQILFEQLIKASLTKNGISIYKDRLYIENKEHIKEGLRFSVEKINDNYYLKTSVAYFVPDEDNDKYFGEIIPKYNKLYAAKNYQKRQELFDDIFKSKMEFLAWPTSMTIEADLEKVNNRFYNCAEEPIMKIGNGFCSKNQIELLNNHGAIIPKFSKDKIRLAVVAVEEDKAKIKLYLDQLINGINKSSYAKQYKGFFKTFKKELTIDYNPAEMIRSSMLKNMTALDVAKFFINTAKKIYDNRKADLVIIYIGSKLLNFKEKDNFNLHDYVKLHCLNAYLTQFIEEETIMSFNTRVDSLFNLAVAIYTKTVGVPWIPNKYDTKTLYVGIGFGINSEGIHVGCSQIFDGAGRGMQLIVSNVSDKNRINQYLSEDEAYELGIKIRQTYYESNKTNFIERIVIHKSHKFMSEEIKGFVKAFKGIETIDLIEISEITNFNCYRLKNNEVYGYPVSRGTTIKISQKSAYVWIGGSLYLYVGNYKNLRNTTFGMGHPLKITRAYGKSNINTIVDDLLMLSKMDFNSANVVYSNMPVTIKYSRKVCDILKQGKISQELIDFRYIM